MDVSSAVLVMTLCELAPPACDVSCLLHGDVVSVQLLVDVDSRLFV